MQSYPNNVPSSIVGAATSASLAGLTAYLNNFAALSVTVYTASLALNISGSNGNTGSNYTIVGATGDTGGTGLQGYRGNSLYILSGSWNTGSCVPAPCYAIEFGYASLVGSEYSCDYGLPTTLYSSTATTVNPGDTVYSNSNCTIQAANLSGLAYGPLNAVMTTNGSGVLSSIATCGNSF